jgi:hypothetical protein
MEEEPLYVVYKLRELRLRPGSLWAALSENPATYAKEQPGTHTISFVPRGILMLTVVRTAALLSQTVDVSPSCQAHSELREAFIARQSVPFLLAIL